MSKANVGNYFEDFEVGGDLIHATPRTITEGDVSLYTGLYGGKYAVHSADTFAMDLGYDQAPVDDFLVFHMVFGKTVPDVSLNAVANLGYARGVFGEPVYPGDTVQTVSKVIGKKENSNGKTGVVYVNSVGTNQRGEMVLDYCRWVMVHKKDVSSPAPEAVVPDLPKAVAAEDLIVPELSLGNFDTDLSGRPHLWEDYEVGEKLDHRDGMTVEDAEHMLATRLYQNTARVHFDAALQKNSRFGKRLVYGGHVISLARSLSFNGLANSFRVAAINGGRHVAPIFHGDTVYAWSEVLDKMEIPGRPDVGALRIRMTATKDAPCDSFPYKDDEGKYDPAVVLDFDYTVLVPRK